MRRKASRMPTLDEAARPYIEQFLMLFGLEARRTTQEYGILSNGDINNYSKSFYFTAEENRILTFSYYAPPRTRWPNPNLFVSYAAILARTEEEMKRIKSSGLLGTLVGIIADMQHQLTPEYFWHQLDSKGGIKVEAPLFDHNNSTEWNMLAGELRHIHTTIDDYVTMDQNIGNPSPNTIH